VSLLDEFFEPRSYQAARLLARGEPGGLTATANATLVRSLITLPGLLAVKIPWRKAVAGAVLGNILVSATVIGYYLNSGLDQPDPTSEKF
jgi:hypothetical protein